MASTGMRTAGGRSRDRGEIHGILVRGGKYIVHRRLPGPEGKKTWIKRNDLESAQRLVEICSLYIDAFNALPTGHPDRNLQWYRKDVFEEFALQQLEAERNSHQELGIIQRIAIEDSTHDNDDERIDESMMPTDAPVPSFADYEVGTNLQNPGPQGFVPPCDADRQAAGFRDSLGAAITPELHPLHPPTHVRARENEVMCWCGSLEFLREKLREQELEEEKLQQRHNLERRRMQQRFCEDVLSGWKQCRRAPHQESATELGKQKVLKACKCASVSGIWRERARVFEKREQGKEDAYISLGLCPGSISVFFFSKVGPVFFLDLSASKYSLTRPR